MATITPISGSDLVKDSRAVINTNFTNLNTDKAETNSPTLITPKIAGSSTGSTAIVSANASATNYTIIFKAEDGTVALMSDIPLKEIRIRIPGELVADTANYQ